MFVCLQFTVYWCVFALVDHSSIIAVCVCVYVHICFYIRAYTSREFHIQFCFMIVRTHVLYWVTIEFSHFLISSNPN